MHQGLDRCGDVAPLVFVSQQGSVHLEPGALVVEQLQGQDKLVDAWHSARIAPEDSVRCVAVQCLCHFLRQDQQLVLLEQLMQLL